MTISRFNRVRCICAWRGGGKAKERRGKGSEPSNTQDGIGAGTVRPDWMDYVSRRLDICIPWISYTFLFRSAGGDVAQVLYMFSPDLQESSLLS